MGWRKVVRARGEGGECDYEGWQGGGERYLAGMILQTYKGRDGMRIGLWLVGTGNSFSIRSKYPVQK